jgi:hypothetical protein
MFAYKHLSRFNKYFDTWSVYWKTKPTAWELFGRDKETCALMARKMMMADDTLPPHLSSGLVIWINL